MRALRGAEQSYHAKSDTARYGTLQELSAAGLIDYPLSTGTKAGYKFDLRVDFLALIDTSKRCIFRTKSCPKKKTVTPARD